MIVIAKVFTAASFGFVPLVLVLTVPNGLCKKVKHMFKHISKSVWKFVALTWGQVGTFHSRAAEETKLSLSHGLTPGGSIPPLHIFCN